MLEPVEMIAWFDREGTPRPLRYRRECEEEREVIAIRRLLDRRVENLAGNRMMVYQCQSVIEGREVVYELKYEISTCKWYLRGS